MTNQQHPITPPPELVEQWDGHGKSRSNAAQILATAAAQWGADQELEACCEWLGRYTNDHIAIYCFRNDRRPKPPSLKKQALLQLDTLNADLAMHGRGCDLSQIRRALEQLND